MHQHSTKLALLTIVTLALLATSPLGAGERLALRVSPRMAFAPATLVVDAVAERDPANRALQIQVNSSDYYRSSLMQLDGDQAPRTTTVRYEGVPGRHVRSACRPVWIGRTATGDDLSPRRDSLRHGAIKNP